MIGAFVGGLFDGFKAGQDILEARNKLAINAQLMEANKAYMEKLRNEGSGGTPGVKVEDYGGGGDQPGSGSSTPPAEALPPEEVKGGVRRGAGGWGSHAQIAIETARGAGASDAAIQAMMANGLGEGGFQEPWKKAGGGENSFGHWQFNRNGELPGYLNFVKKEGGDPTDTRLQTLYALKRANEVYPGFSQLTDAKTATDIFATRFERYKGAAPGQRYGLLTDAQRYMAGQPVEPRQTIPAGPRGYTGDEPAQAIPAGPRGYGAEPTTSGGVPAFTEVPGGRASALGEPAEVPAAPPSGMGTGLAAPTGALPPSALNTPTAAPAAAPAAAPPPSFAPPANYPGAAPAGQAPAGQKGGVTIDGRWYPSTRDWNLQRDKQMDDANKRVLGQGAAQQRITVPPPSPLNVSSAPAPVPPPIKPVSSLGIGGAPQPSAAFPVASGGSNLFPAPRRAPDGREYVPDPDRPGKYLMVG